MGQFVFAVILVYLLIYGGFYAAGLFATWFGHQAAVWGVLIPVLAAIAILLKLKR